MEGMYTISNVVWIYDHGCTSNPCSTIYLSIITWNSEIKEKYNKIITS